MASSIQSQIDALLDQTLPVSERARVAHGLGDMESPDAKTALLDVAQDTTEDDTVARAAGESLAKILIRYGSIADAPLHDFAGPAYLGFDETVAAHQRALGVTPGGDTTGVAFTKPL